MTRYHPCRVVKRLNSKHEIRNPKQYQNSNFKIHPHPALPLLWGGEGRVFRSIGIMIFSNFPLPALQDYPLRESAVTPAEEPGRRVFEFRIQNSRLADDTQGKEVKHL